jgi:aryl-alcohol dehydrogenase-like predicted oxidoreductase
LESIDLPETELRVSRIILGCEQLGGVDWGEFDPLQARSMVNTAWDVGINTFDVADVYGLGRAEEFLAQCLGPRRKDAVIISKGGINWRPGIASRAETFRDSSPRHIREAADASLKRLCIDCLPMYMIHWPDLTTPLGDTIETLQDLQRLGKIRYFGLSNFSPEWIQLAAQIEKPSAVEMSYSLVDRTGEDGTLPTCSALNIPVMAYGVLAQGFLSGKYNASSSFPESDRRHRLSAFTGQSWNKNDQLLKKLESIATRHGKSVAQVAIGWVLDRSDICCAIVGAKNADQVAKNAESANWHPTSEERLYLE